MLCLMKTDGDIAAIRFNLGSRIRVLRKEQDLSQYAFASMINMDRTYILSVEKGRRNISIDNLTKIAGGLGISLSELFRDVDEAESVARRRAIMEQLERERKEKEAAKQQEQEQE